MRVKFSDYVGQTVTARYTIERNIDGADVPVIREGEVTVGMDGNGILLFDEDGDFVYPCDDTFELLTPKP